ncbi:MAG: RecX family transcriptional regulator [Clostridia bacterium]|nr:RecX family transcriptional regulator [Clostridia bacterium]
MGTITEISSQKNKKRVNVFVDGEFVSGLSFESAVKHGLKTGKVIDEGKLKLIIEESEVSSAFEAALGMIAITSKSSKEIKDKLARKGFNESVIQKAIDKLKEYRYLNDAEFAKAFVRSFPGKSRRELESKLKQKGILAEDMAEALAEIDEESEKDGALAYARKYLRGKEWNEKTKNNLFAGLARKGFSFDIISSVIEAAKKEKEE